MSVSEEEAHLFFEYNAYPFNKGRGLEKTLEILGYKLIWQSPKKIRIINKSVFEIFKEENKDEKLLLIRPDNIKKKLKSNFHKCIILILNNGIKAFSLDKYKKYFFSNLSQSFITNIKVKENSEVMDSKFKDLLLSNEKNQETINYLNNNYFLSANIKWNKIKDMTYKQLLEAYFSSAEFEKSICDLKAKSEKRNKIVGILYIENYINTALSYIDFYSTPNQQEESSQDISSSMNLMDTFPGNNNEYTWQSDSEDPFCSLQRNDAPAFVERSFGGVDIRPDEDEMIIDDIGEINNEKMNISDMSGELNDSFEEKDHKKMINYLINEQNKRNM